MMDPTNQAPPAASQASSHFPLEPVSGALLFEQDASRRDDHTSGGRLLMTGCRELDVEVLCGGFERGCVVGISAEEGEEGVALVLALQTLARAYVSASVANESKAAAAANVELPRAIIITTSSMGALLPLLRDVYWGQVAAVGGAQEDKKRMGGSLQGFLERIEVARVFDVPGLWEVLGDLDRLVDAEHGEATSALSQSTKEHGDDMELPQPGGENDNRQDFTEPSELLSSSPLSDPPSSLPDDPPWDTTDMDEGLPRKTPPGCRDEIQDSEDEGGEDSSSLASAEGASHLSAGLPPENPPSDSVPRRIDEPDHSEDWLRQAPTSAKSPQAGASADFTESRPPRETPSKALPDMVIITHMSNLLSTLFQQRDKSTAHQTLQLLSSHIRYLSRAPEHGGPLIMLLNSTTSSSLSSDKANPTVPDRDYRPPPPPPADNPSLPAPRNKPLDPTLRSIFNPSPLPVSGLNYAHDTPHSRRNKPSFGLIFTQMLDMHFLCTRLPKTRDDAEALYAPTETGDSTANKSVAYGWVVEVLLDEMGIWKSRTAVEEGQTRRSREQRWGAVEIRRSKKGVAIADLLGKKDMSGEVVVAAGFGGRRV